MTPHSLTGEELRRWREQQNLSQEEFGALLHTSREWIGKLERGEREISADIFLRFEAVKRDTMERELQVPKEFSPSDLDGPVPGPMMVAEESVKYNPAAAAVRREIRNRLDSTIQLAGDDVGRLGWIREQLMRHVAPPAHWGIHEQVIKQVLAEEKVRADTREKAQSGSSHGKAS